MHIFYINYYIFDIGTSPLSRHNRPEQLGNSSTGPGSGAVGTNGPNAPVASLVRLRCGGVGADPDSFWSDSHTGPAARTAAGCVIDLAHKVNYIWTININCN